MTTSNHRVAAVAAGAAILVGFGSFGAVASGMITSADIKNHEVKTADIDRGAVGSGKIEDGSVKMRDLDPSTVSELQGGKTAGDAPQGAKGEKGDTGPQGPAGAQGPKGRSGLEGAYYSVAFYNAGDTNAGAIATVACNEQTDVAISGGVQTLGLETDENGRAVNNRNTPVSNSFPGRMDWSTNMPRPDRLDGWIVQFGGNAGATSDKAPEKAKIWALCIPNANIPVEQTYLEVEPTS